MDIGFDKSVIFRSSPAPPSPIVPIPSQLPSLLPSQIFLSSPSIPAPPLPAPPVRPLVPALAATSFTSSDRLNCELDLLCSTAISFTVNREFAGKWKYIDGRPLAEVKAEGIQAAADLHVIKEVIDLETKGQLMQIGLQKGIWRVRTDGSRVRVKGVKGVKAEKCNFMVKQQLAGIKVEAEMDDEQQVDLEGLRFMVPMKDEYWVKLEKKEEGKERIDGRLRNQAVDGQSMREDDVQIESQIDNDKDKEKEKVKDAHDVRRRVKFMFKK